MACKKCKNKNNSESYKEIYEQTNGFPKGIVIFFVVWSALSIYGIYSLVTKFI